MSPAIEYRWAEGQFERLPELAAELVRRKVPPRKPITGIAGCCARRAAI